MAPSFRSDTAQILCRFPIALLRRRNIKPARIAALALFALTSGAGVQANEAKVVLAKASCDTARVCSFDVTVRHADTGWDHYANAWRVLAVDGAAAGKELGKRVLHHPHENEQPFTRSLSGVKIPEDTTQVDIEALDSVHEGGGAMFRLNVPEGTPAN